MTKNTYIGTGEPTQVITGDSDSWGVIMVKETKWVQYDLKKDPDRIGTYYVREPKDFTKATIKFKVE